MTDIALFAATFLACLVEAVEATTIVLAVGTARHWGSALLGVLGGLAVLGILVLVAGPAISLLPLGILRLVVGGLLLVFGLGWIRKAVLRYSGYKSLHDEEQIYRREVDAALRVGEASRGAVQDWYAFALSFKGVLLEGLEVVFIVVTFGASQGSLLLAATAAGAAVVVVVLVGVIVRGPLSRVPENSLKFVVGVMLTAFGVFWGVEGAGAEWPGGDAALLVIAPAIAILSLGIALGLRRHRERRADSHDDSRTAAPPAAPTSTGSDPAQAPTSVSHRTLRARVASFGAFWYDFVIGDDWQIAVGVVLSFAMTVWFSSFTTLAWIVVPVAVTLLIPYGIRRSLDRARTDRQRAPAPR